MPYSPRDRLLDILSTAERLAAIRSDVERVNEQIPAPWTGEHTLYNHVMETCGHPSCEWHSARERLVSIVPWLLDILACRECLQHPERTARAARLCLTCAEKLFGPEDDAPAR